MEGQGPEEPNITWKLALLRALLRALPARKLQMIVLFPHSLQVLEGETEMQWQKWLAPQVVGMCCNGQTGM